MSSPSTRVSDRYELGETLGRGGMGVVYKAYDSIMRRHVALKTIVDVDNETVRELFYKEWGVQANIVHPNVAEIYDIGEIEHEGQLKPFFVMPLLPGVGLDALIAEKSPRLTVERLVRIFDQACRGLQAAHDSGLIHRDLKPSNIFVMEDDSVKIIDFGIAHVVETGAKTNLKGTLSYTAPEQLKMEAPSPRSDIFSLGVSCYEALTGRRPFRGNSDHEISDGILNRIPAPVSELNEKVSEPVSQVIHKALAKDPWHRFASARELGEALVKASRNERIEIFDPEKIKPRLERAEKSFEGGDYEFAREIVAELEAEGLLDPQITFLRRQLDKAVKQTQIQKLLEAARRYQEAEEHGLALRKVQEALDLDPQDNDAQALQHSIEKERREQQIGEWMTLARRHFENDSFGPAREAIQSILEVKSTDTDALRLQAEIDRREREVEQRRRKKSALYDAARQAFDRGEVTAALSRMENLAEIEREHPDTASGRSGTYRQFHQQVRSEHEELKSALDRARTLLAEEKFGEALEICGQWLAKYPNHALFQALRFDVEQRQRQTLSSYIADVDRRLDAETNLDKRLAILEEALERYPEEPHFQQAAKTVQDRRDLVGSIVSKAQFFEEKERFQDALDQWEILRSIDSKFEGLDMRVDELTKRRDAQKTQEEKARVAENIDRLIEDGAFEQATAAVDEALDTYPGDPTIQGLKQVAEKSAERTRLAGELLTEGRAAIEAGRFEEGLETLREARRTNEGDPILRSVLVNALVEHGRRRQGENREQADALLAEALEHEPENQTAQALRGQLHGRKKEDFLTEALTEARRLQAENEIDAALGVVAEGLERYPGDQQLEQLQATLNRAKERTHAPITEPTSLPELFEEEEDTQADGPAAAPAADEPVAAPAEDAPSATGDAAEKPAAEERPAAAPPKLDRRWIPAALIGAGLAIGTGMIFVITGLFGGEEAPPPVATAFPVLVRTTPSGAQVRVDGRPCLGSPCSIELEPGNHVVEASMAGYRPGLLELNVDAENPPGETPFFLTLEPLLPALEIASDFERGQVRLDGEVVGEVEDGELRLDELPAASTSSSSTTAERA